MNTPDWIDYEGGSTEIERGLWSAKAFKKHFMDEFWRNQRVGGAIPWTVKEQTLLAKAIAEFDTADLANMISYWHENNTSPSVACQFKNFYNKRIEIYYKLKEKDDIYSWEN